jgi:diguanylate cyclase (GGDEF)-like protein
VPLYALTSSTRVYDLRGLLNPSNTELVASGEARVPPVTPQRKPRPEPGAGSGARSAPARAPRASESSKSRANARNLEAEVSRNGQAWVSLGAIRSTLRRDWVTYGLEASLEDLLAQLRERLQDPDLRCAVWPERLGTPVREGQGWEVLAETESTSVVLLQGIARVGGGGFEHGGRRWFGVWARENIVAALGCPEPTDPALATEAAAAVGDLVLASLRSQRRVYTDPLTGVNNRSFFDHQFPVELERSRRAGVPLALLFADLDFFKRVNDRHGHEAGDRVLVHVARSFQSHLRRIDYVFRWGGEEFAMLLPGTDLAEALQTSERLRKVVETTPVRTDESSLAVTVSIGVAVYPLHAQGELELLRHADQALYRAKDAGRNRVEAWRAGNARA